ncbi:MAG: xanthine dehydrogenase family protein molybdopterin-binding subunit [Alphaproteobacteria bacterium]|nr:xanthine dehydrogenase family protein molybdopterin-binding subunit [Alphaproteobacteria bacterium]
MSNHPSLSNSPKVADWLDFSSENQLVLHTGKVDIGQRITTALALIAAEELGISFQQINVRKTKTDIDPNEGYTAGSFSMQHSGYAIKKATATARHIFTAKAAQRLNVPEDQIEISDGQLRASGTNQSVTYWELLDKTILDVDVDEEVKTKNPEDYSVQNQPHIAKGMAEIMTGKYQFLHDLKFSDMLHARVVRPPHYHCVLESLDNDVVLKLSQENIHVVQDGSFIAVAAQQEYQAVKAARRVSLAAKWKSEKQLSEADIYSLLTSNNKDRLFVEKGCIPSTTKQIPELEMLEDESHITISATYKKPYHMHASIGPSAGCANFNGKTLRVWTHNQGVYPLRAAVSEAFDMDVDKVSVEFVPGAGVYGHNGADDAAFDAAIIARHLPNHSILLKWTRDDENSWEPYGSAMQCEIQASVDKKGKISSWSHETYADTFLTRPIIGKEPASRMVSSHYLEKSLPWPVVGPMMVANGGIHRNMEMLYEMPEPRLVKNRVYDLPLRTSALRTLGAFGNVFANESMIDELAEKADIDPIEFRLSHLKDERAIKVISELQQLMAESQNADVDETGYGMGFARYKNSAAYCAIGVCLSVNEAAEVKLHDAFIVCDAGEVVDAEGVRAQLEGGFIQAASWCLYEQVLYERDGIVSRDWDTYPIITFDNIPRMHTRLIENQGMPYLGAGEAAAGPTAAAISNAISQATGLRVRQMPFNSDAIMAAALED